MSMHCFSLQVFLAVILGFTALLTAGYSPLPDDAAKTLSPVLKASGCQGCFPRKEGAGELEGEDEGEGELDGEDEGEVPAMEDGEDEGQAEGEIVEPEPECAVLATHPRDRQVLVQWSCPNGDQVSRYVLLRGTEIPLDSKGVANGGHRGETFRAADKRAYTCEQVYSGTENSFVDQGLTNGQEYLYTLRGYDAAGTVICRGYEAGVPMDPEQQP